MTEVKIISKKSQSVVEIGWFDKDETIEVLLYWVRVALAAHSGVFAQFRYEGSTYIVSIDE